MKNMTLLCAGLASIVACAAAHAQNTTVFAAISTANSNSLQQEIVGQYEGYGLVLAKFAVNHSDRPGGAGSRIIDGLYLHTVEGEEIEASVLPEIEIDHSPNDSYLYIRGTIHAGGQEYHAVAPKLSSLDRQLRENAPDECGIYLLGDTQLKQENHFLVKYLFEDTLNKGICWDYFRSLDSFSIDPKVISVIEYNLQFRPPQIAAVDSGPDRVKVGPLILHQSP